MKLKVFTLFAVLLLMGSVAFSQDAGNPDSLRIVVISPALTVGLPSQPFTVACSVYVDANSLTTLQFGIKWDNTDLVLDSALGFGAFNNMGFGPFFYLDGNINTSNDSNIAICSNTSISNHFPPGASWRHIANFYFTINNWSAARGTINVDTVQHPSYASTEYIFLPLGGTPYGPVWKGPINVSSSAIGERDLGIVPTSFELAQNFPNPFNPTTKIKYGLPTKSHVSLKIFNLLGQEIITLVDEDKPANTYEIEWDGRDKNQTEVASGIYFYKLIAGDYIDTKKMMLVK